MPQITGPEPTTLPPTPYSTRNCTYISEACPVEFTIYGFFPNLGASWFFCIFFGIFFGLQFIQGLRWKNWTFMIALTWGCIAECVGYVGRIMLHHNPWSSNAFDIQIVCLIIAPAFIAAGIYLNLKHIVLEIGTSFSRLRPKYYTWIFILCDIFSLVLQGAGGGIAATANNGSTEQKTGNNLMLAGIVFQVFTLLVFAFFVIDYAIRAYQHRATLEPSAHKLMATTRWKLFIGSLTLAFITVFMRCVFRIGEMAKGWGNPVMQDQTDFIVLDSVMITIAVFCLTVFHPGYTFPEMRQHGSNSPVGEFSGANKEMTADIESTPPSLDGANGTKTGESKPKVGEGYFGAQGT